MSRDHGYESLLLWTGSTSMGYSAYDRTHQLKLPPAVEELTLSSDAAFLGDADLANPEQLLLGAASSCQLLSFLAVAARGGIDVVGYEDAAEALLPGDSRPMRITRIILRPAITVVAGPTEAEVLAMVEQAHQECYIANTINAELLLEPTVIFSP